MRRPVGLVLLVVGVLLALVGVGLQCAFLWAQPARGGFFFGVSLIMALAGLVLIGVGVWLMRGARPIGGAAGGVKGYRPNVPEARALDGAAYEVIYQPPGKGRNPSPSSLIVRVPAVTPATLRFNKQNWYDRMCMRLGIVPAQQTGDSEFDTTIYVRGPSRRYAEEFAQDGDTRAAVLALFRHGFREVRLTGTSLEAVWSGFKPETHHRADLKDDAASELLFLADGLPATDADDDWARPDRGFVWTVLLWLCGSAYAALLFCAFWYAPVRAWDLISTGLGVAAVAYPLFSLSAVLLLRGNSTAHDRLAPLLTVGVLLICLGSIGGVAAINALADASPPERRTVMVLNKHYSSGRHGKSYYITVRAWNGRDERIDFSVSAAEYFNIAPGRSHLELTTGRGALGIEWVIARQVRL